MAKYCSNCGTKVNENAVVCVGCGCTIKENNYTSNNIDKNATVGMILGIVSIIAWIIPLFGYPVTICGIVFSAKGLKSSTAKTKATVGLVLSIIFLIVTLINSIAGVLMYTNIYTTG